MTQLGLLATAVLTHAAGDLAIWLDQRQQLVSDWRQIIFNAQQGSQHDFSMYAMTCRKLADLSRYH